MQTTLASAARNRLETIFRRGFPVITLILMSESFVNMFAQRIFLNQLSDIYALSLVASLILCFVLSWRAQSRSWPIGLFALLVTGGYLLWPAMLKTGVIFPTGYEPWFWWLVGIAGIGAAIAFPTWLAVLYVFLNSVIWIPFHNSADSGNADLAVSTQDAIYIFLICNTLVAVMVLLRRAALRTDAANTASIEREIERAKIDAVERERLRLDALVHDKVLNTLLLAANATNKKDRERAASLASESIRSLESARSDRAAGKVNPQGLFRALEIAAKRMSPEIKVSIESATLLEIPTEAASALTEATLQALDNAIQHSKADSIELRLSASRTEGLGIFVKDNGQGFRLERIARNRIGLRTSIFQKAELVGAKVTLDSEIGKGTQIEIRWKG